MQRLRSIAVAFTALACAGFSAHATTTFVNPLGGGNGGERCLFSTGSSCSGGSYNGALSLISAFEIDLGFSAGSFTRVDDALDRIWTNTASFGEVQARARYASDNSRLGYDAGSGYVNLTSVLTDADNRLVLVENRWDFAGDPRFGDFVSAADSWKPIALAAGTPFVFMLHDKTTGNFFSSNSAGFDHMVTFRVPDAIPHFFIAWEDRNPGDRDYNDLVVEVRYTNPVAHIPEPETYALMLAGLGLIGFVARRRKAALRR